ncbi:MAG: RMD1 family protein [Patescibacteria group bacterium]|nr:RMD1 family protein [Patescibacteria group bacterium]
MELKPKKEIKEIKAIELAKNFEIKEIYTRFRKMFTVISYNPSYIYFAVYPKRKQYLLVLKYGVVVLINNSEIFEKRILSLIEPLIKEKSLYNFEKIKIVVDTRSLENKVLFDRVILFKEDEKYGEILAILLAQSLALEAYERKVDKLLVEFSQSFQNLAFTLKRIFSPGISKIVTEIQETIFLHQDLIANLEILDKPETAWEKKEYNDLYFDFSQELELPERISILEQKISLLKGNMTTILEIVNARRLEILELIIIILILISVIQGIFYFK